jgi:hypothetical protein
MSNGYSQDWYRYIDELVIRYQDNEGREEAATELLEAFKPYLTKYFRIIRSGILNLKDIDTRKFISLFIADGRIRRALCRKRLSGDVKNAAFSAAHLICSSFELTSSEDIQQQLSCILLVLANRYLQKRKRLTFAGYVFNAFRFELYRTVEVHTTDPLTYASSLIITYNDGEFIEETTDFAISTEFLQARYIAIPDEELDTNWIYGLTCHDWFLEFTPLERLILRMSYVDGLSDMEISKRTGYHINTINRRRNAAKKELMKYKQDYLSDVRG